MPQQFLFEIVLFLTTFLGYLVIVWMLLQAARPIFLCVSKLVPAIRQAVSSNLGRMSVSLAFVSPVVCWTVFVLATVLLAMNLMRVYL